MKAAALTFAVIASFGAGNPFTLKAAQEDARLLNAIAAVESGHVHHAVGDRGASLGAWQMQADAWADANNHRRRLGSVQHPRSSWRDPLVQEEMAASFLRVIRQRFAAAGIPRPTPEQIAVVWNRGWSAAKRIGFRPNDYAKRVANVYRLQGS